MDRNLGEIVVEWANSAPDVVMLVLIGSRVRPCGTVAAADGGSDWDFQIATTEPARFATADWLGPLGLKPLAYVLRPGRLGSSLKASAVTTTGELDLVVLPAEGLRELAGRDGAGLPGGKDGPALRDLAAVLGGGYRMIKGEAEFGAFFRRVAGESRPLRLTDEDVVQLADAFCCDYVSTRRKIDRGELLAAERWLHLQLRETNFRLLHELRLRQGQISFPDGRRLEILADPVLQDWVAGTGTGEKGLRAAVENAANVHRKLVSALLGGAERWPDVTRLGLRTE